MRVAGGGCASLAVVTVLACGCGEPTVEVEGPPNVLFVVWDTVRADHLSLHGYARATTPNLERWARDALVFTDALSTANSTVPSHASLFTGLLPSEHGSHAGHQYLDDHHVTLAEIFQAGGYQTYLWAANPHISAAENFTQGFDLAEHPWSPRNEDEARRIVLEKLEGDRSSGMRQRIASKGEALGLLKAAGTLAERNVLEFLSSTDSQRPWFVFLNYMEAHRQYIPPRPYREALMSPEQVERSYRLDRSWPTVWAHTFGIERYSDPDLAVIEGTYDAALRELDELFASLLGALGERGLLRNTVVVLTADHGELVGEHGLLGHQYSLYEPLLHVPLVLYYPPRVAPGVSTAPVLAMDVFPTLLELAGLEAPLGLESRARSLLDPPSERVRLAEYPAFDPHPLDLIRKRVPDFDPEPWEWRLRALHSSSYKFIEAEDGKHELYDRSADPSESRDLTGSRPELAERLQGELFRVVRSLSPAQSAGSAPSFSEDQARMLTQLGYASDAGPSEVVRPEPRAATSWSLGPAPGSTR